MKPASARHPLERVGRRAAGGERREHAQRPVGEVGLGSEQRRGDPVAGEAVEGERGFQRGGAAAGDQDVRGHAGSFGAGAAARRPGQRRVVTCGKPAVERRAAPDGGPHRRAVALRAMHLLIAGGGPAALEGALAVQRLAGERVRDHAAQRPRRRSSTARSPSPSRSGSPPRSASRCRSSPPSAASSCGSSALLRDRPRRAPRAHRRDGELPYDALLLALGAAAEEAIPGALTFRGPEDTARLRAALEHLHAGEPLRVAFVAGTETAWTLPLYELALLTARWADERGLALEPWVVTWEHRPLTIFGEEAATAVAELLADAGVRLWTGAFAEAVEDGRLWISVEGGLPVDLAVALPRPVGRRIPGPARRRARLRAGRRALAACPACRRLRRRRHDVATAQAGRARDPAGRRGRRRDRRRGRRRRRGRGVPAGAARDAAHRRTVRATCAALPASAARPRDDAPWWPPHKIAGPRARPLPDRPPRAARSSRFRPEVAAMSSKPTPPPLRVLVAGGGVAALEAVLALRALARDRVAIELLAPAGDFVAAPVVGALAVQRRAGAARAARPPAGARRHPPPRLARRRRHRRARGAHDRRRPAGLRPA